MDKYKVWFVDGNRIIKGDFRITKEGHLLFYNEEKEVFAGFASGQWSYFAKVGDKE